jgi:lipopolysaccharide/colanic/teichoic acid biosynthesis glycosyltransferase
MTSVAVILVEFFSDVIKISRGYLLISLVVTTALVSLGRFGVRRVLRWRWSHGLVLRRVLVVGANAQGIQLARDLSQHPAASAQVVGLLDEYRPVGSMLHGFQVVGDPLRVAASADRLGATHVVIAQSALSWEGMRHVVDYLHRRPGVEVLLAPSFHAVNASPVDVVQFGAAPMLAPALTRIRGVEAGLKRLLELAIVIPVLVLTLPLRLGITAVLAARRQPVFVNRRVHGLGLDEFTLTTFAVAAGGWLDEHHLERLPSLWRVVTGHMSLIGPRPISIGDAAAYERHLLVLGSLRPGFIGPWWLVQQGRPGAVDDEIRFDLEYARNYTIWMDLRVLLRVTASLLGGQRSSPAAENTATTAHRPN